MEADTEIARVWEGASSCDRADGQMEFWAQSRWTQIENHSHPAALICRASFIALPQVSLGNSKARLLLKPWQSRLQVIAEWYSRKTACLLTAGLRPACFRCVTWTDRKWKLIGWDTWRGVFLLSSVYCFPRFPLHTTFYRSLSFPF